MKKASIASLLVFAVLIASTSDAIGQMAEKGWEKTVTLPSGEVILDMSGEWDVLYTFYGVFWHVPIFGDILTITQDGTKFTAVKQIGSRWVPKGAETIKGELDKDGFKEVYSYVHVKEWKQSDEFIWEPCEWEISENGNKVVLDCGERSKSTLNSR